MLEYSDFYDSLVGFFPIRFPSIIEDILLYFAITPLSSTYAPGLYVFYPLILVFDPEVELVLAYTLCVNILLNSTILIYSYRQISNKRKSKFILVMLVFGLSIGNLIYVGSNMPYAFIFSSTVLVGFMSSNKHSKLGRDCLILTALYLLNYQIILLIPSYFIAKAFTLKKEFTTLKLRELLNVGLLLSVVITSLLFFHKRGQITGTHTDVGINWNSGVNNEFMFNIDGNIAKECLDFVHYFPRSVAYHWNSELFEFDKFSIVFWTFILLVIIRIVKRKTVSPLACFSLVSFAVLLFLVLIQKSVFGPTRHTLIFLPVLLLLVISQIDFSIAKTTKVLLVLVLVITGIPNINTILNRGNNFIHQLSLIRNTIEQSDSSDILLFSCTYQPFLDESFRQSVIGKRIHFFCGDRLQLLNSEYVKKDNLIILDATGQNEDILCDELNKRLNYMAYKPEDFTLIETLVELDYNMEQKDYTQLPKSTGLFIWKTHNALP